MTKMVRKSEMRELLTEADKFCGKMTTIRKRKTPEKYGYSSPNTSKKTKK